MPITANFSTTQSVGAPSVIDFSDTSTGSDVTATQRRIYLVNAQGNYVVPSGTGTDYVNFPLSEGADISIDCLAQDSALWITLQYLDINNVVVASKTLLKGFSLYNETFYYSLTQAQATQSVPPNILQDTMYLQNKSALRVFLDSAANAITYGQDITTAQNMYDAATYLTTNEQMFF